MAKVIVICGKIEKAVQVSIPLWSLVHLPVIVTVTTAAFTEKVRHRPLYMLCILHVPLATQDNASL